MLTTSFNLITLSLLGLISLWLPTGSGSNGVLE